MIGYKTMVTVHRVNPDKRISPTEDDAIFINHIASPAKRDNHLQ
jgi:hypothetical protein